jgi:hypothetical protein
MSMNTLANLVKRAVQRVDTFMGAAAGITTRHRVGFGNLGDAHAQDCSSRVRVLASSRRCTPVWGRPIFGPTTRPGYAVHSSLPTGACRRLRRSRWRTGSPTSRSCPCPAPVPRSWTVLQIVRRHPANRRGFGSVRPW